MGDIYRYRDFLKSLYMITFIPSFNTDVHDYGIIYFILLK